MVSSDKGGWQEISMITICPSSHLVFLSIWILKSRNHTKFSKQNFRCWIGRTGTKHNRPSYYCYYHHKLLAKLCGLWSSWCPIIIVCKWSILFKIHVSQVSIPVQHFYVITIIGSPLEMYITFTIYKYIKLKFLQKEKQSFVFTSKDVFTFTLFLHKLRFFHFHPLMPFIIQDDKVCYFLLPTF